MNTPEHKNRLDMIVRLTTHEQRAELLGTCLMLIADMSVISEKGVCPHVQELAKDVLGPMSALLTKHHGEAPLKRLLEPYVQARAVEMMAQAAGVANGEAN